MVIGALGIVIEGLVPGLEDLEIRDHPNYSIVKIGQNTQESHYKKTHFPKTTIYI